MKRIDYSEKVLEENIKLYPQVFLDEELEFISQQKTIEGLRPDLIFKDKRGAYVVVEVQINALDRNHLYKSLEYRDLIVVYEQQEQVRVILVCNSLPAKYQNTLRRYKIESKVISIGDFVEKVKQVTPEVKLILTKNQVKLRKQQAITTGKILSLLSTRGKNDIDLDAYVFWQNIVCHHGKHWNYFNYRFDLNLIKNQGQIYFNEYDGYAKYYYSDYYDEDDYHSVEVPNQIVISGEILRKITVADIRRLSYWIDFLSQNYFFSEFVDDEIVLGFRENYYDFYEYERYITGRIRKFQPLWHLYIDDNYNKRCYYVERIKEDLSLLQELILYAGKYPDFQSVQFCKGFEIVEGTGNWKKSFPFTREQIEASKFDDFKKNILLDIQKQQWITVKFYGLCKSYIKVMDTFLTHLISHHESNFKDKDKELSLNEILKNNIESEKLSFDSNIECWHCTMPAKHINTIKPNALELSNKYFAHMKSPEDLINVKDEKQISE